MRVEAQRGAVGRGDRRRLGDAERPGIEIHSASKMPARREESSDSNGFGSHPPIWYISSELNDFKGLQGFAGVRVRQETSGARRAPRAGDHAALAEDRLRIGLFDPQPLHLLEDQIERRGTRRVLSRAARDVVPRFSRTNRGEPAEFTGSAALETQDMGSTMALAIDPGRSSFASPRPRPRSDRDRRARGIRGRLWKAARSRVRPSQAASGGVRESAGL